MWTSSQHSTPSTGQLCGWPLRESVYLIARLPPSTTEILHTDTGARVKVGSDVSERLHTSSGVRQGCVLEPSPFYRAIDWIMSHMQGLAHVKVGVTTSSRTWIHNRNDIALPATTGQDVTASLSGFSGSL